VLLDPPRPIEVRDAANRTVTVTDRGAVPAPPASLRVGSARPVPITAWAGPWPVDDHWWDTDRPPRRRVRFQLVDLPGRAYLVTCTLSGSPAGTAPSPPRPNARPSSSDDEPQWTLDAVYD
jgi:protein ImuB